MATNQFVLSSEGDFRSITAFDAYVSQFTKQISSQTSINNLEGTTLEVRGVNHIAASTTLSYPVVIKMVGNNGTLVFDGVGTLKNLAFSDLNLTINGAVAISNTSFTNCQITVNSATGFALGNNVSFQGSTITYTYDATSDVNFTVGQLSNPLNGCLFGSTSMSQASIANIKIEDCSFETSITNHFPFIAFVVNDEVDYLENIKITKNRFDSNASGDDKLSVISFVSTLIVNPTANFQGPRVVNIHIEKNICNKNQLIIISAPLNGSNKITNMLTTIDTHIQSNVCGAICYLTKQDSPLTTSNATGKVFDKENMLVIDGNTCKLIYSGFSSGFMNVHSTSNYNVSNIISGQNVYSGSVIIRNNTCSWIQIGVKNPTTYSVNTPKLEASSNKMNAYIATFLNSYNDNLTALNTAVYVNNQVGT